jgi:hypothetical protein
LLVPPIHDRIVLLDAATLAPVHEGADRLPGVRFAVADRAERRLYVLSQVTEDGQPVGVLRAYDLVDE